MSDSAIVPIPHDHPAYRHLVDYLRMRMSAMSEDTWCAGWLIDLEFILWEAIHGEPRGESWRPFAENDLRDIAELSVLVGGWHDYDRFIPLEEWLSIASEHKLKLRAGDPL